MLCLPIASRRRAAHCCSGVKEHLLQANAILALGFRRVAQRDAYHHVHVTRRVDAVFHGHIDKDNVLAHGMGGFTAAQTVGGGKLGVNPIGDFAQYQELPVLTHQFLFAGIVWESGVDVVGDFIGDAGEILAVLEDEVKRRVDQGGAAAPNAAAPHFHILRAFAKTNQQRTARLDQHVAWEQSIALRRVERREIHQTAFIEDPALQAGGAALRAAGSLRCPRGRRCGRQVG